MFRYKDITADRIDDVKELWNKNKFFHQKYSDCFSADYIGLNFEDRIIALLKKSKLTKITVAETMEEKIIAYCMSIVGKTNSGEIATLYVDEEYRRRGIGHHLLKRHFRWFQENDIDDVCVEVLYNNVSAINLYEDIGFRKDIIRMRVPRTESLE